MLGMTMINQMVDALVRPELVMKMMEEGKTQQALKKTVTQDSTIGSGRALKQ